MRLVAAAIAISPSSHLSHHHTRQDIGTLCTSETTPADKQIDACNKIIALKRFSGAQLATVYFWRAVGYNKKGDYNRVIADATEALSLQPDQAPLYNLRGSAYYDKGEYDIAIADFNDALRSARRAAPSFTTAAMRIATRDQSERAIADYTEAIRLEPRSRSRFRTAAPSSRRSAISMARWSTSTTRSGSPRHALDIDQPRCFVARPRRLRSRHRRCNRSVSGLSSAARRCRC